MQRRSAVATVALATIAAAVPFALDAGAQGRGAGHAGFFESVCEFTHRAPDDPIVYPGVAGASHSHDFFGNPSTNAASSLDSLDAARGRCAQRGDRAAYWVPSLRKGGREVQPLRANVYYRTAGRDPASVQPFPIGLRVIAGNAKTTGPQDPKIARWTCTGTEAPPSRLLQTCPRGSRLKLSIVFPDCWNGRDLDSPDHSSHLAYAIRIGRGMKGCPGSHPRAVPRLVVNAVFATRGGRGLKLASGSMNTGHADFFNAWEPAELGRLVRECLNADVHCAPPRRMRR